jgi:hypothetical protein
VLALPAHCRFLPRQLHLVLACPYLLSFILALSSSSCFFQIPSTRRRGALSAPACPAPPAPGAPLRRACCRGTTEPFRAGAPGQAGTAARARCYMSNMLLVLPQKKTGSGAGPDASRENNPCNGSRWRAALPPRIAAGGRPVASRATP